MSRFRNLEFGDEFHKSGAESNLRAKDEGFYLLEATTTFTQGRFEQSLRAYAKVIEHNPANSQAWLGQVQALIELGEFQEAKLWADKAIDKFSNVPELLA